LARQATAVIHGRDINRNERSSHHFGEQGQLALARALLSISFTMNSCSLHQFCFSIFKLNDMQQKTMHAESAEQSYALCAVKGLVSSPNPRRLVMTAENNSQLHYLD
jgi:hypothetical protein